MINPFIENYQYNFIIKQATNISRAAHSVNDKDVKHTFVYAALDKVLALFPDLNGEQEALLKRNCHTRFRDFLSAIQRKITSLLHSIYRID